jgi:hypothetical protein
MLMKQTALNFATMAAVLAGAPLLFAAPFNPKDVAAEPALLVHVDCDAIRASSLGQAILSQQDVQDKLAAVGALFDFDVRTQLHGLTVYTTEDHPKDGALIVYADFDPNRLLTLAKAADGFHGVTNGSHVIYSWLDDKKKGKDGGTPRVYGAISGHRVVIGQDETHLAAALDVIDGTAPGLAGKNGLPQAEAGESILLEGMLLKFDFDDSDDKAAIFKKAKSARLKLSEAGNNMTATVRLEAIDTNTSAQIAAIAQGLLAVVQLQMPNPDVAKLAQGIVIKQDGPVVELRISTSSSELAHDLVNMVKEGQKKEAEKKAEQHAQNATSSPDNK